MDDRNSRLNLNRKQAAHYVTEMWGVPCSYKWLAKLVVVGGGPRHWKWGRAVRYRADALDAWVFGCEPACNFDPCSGVIGAQF